MDKTEKETEAGAAALSRTLTCCLNSVYRAGHYRLLAIGCGQADKL